MIRCFDEQYAKERYATRGPEYQAAMQSAILPERTPGQVCFDSKHPGWVEAVRLTISAANAVEGGGGQFIGIAAAARRLARGAAGMAKVAAGTGIAEQAEIDQRLAICESCPDSTPPGEPVEKRSCGGLLHKTDRPTCGCKIGAKTRLATEHCPQSKW